MSNIPYIGFLFILSSGICTSVITRFPPSYFKKPLPLQQKAGCALFQSRTPGDSLQMIMYICHFAAENHAHLEFHCSEIWIFNNFKYHSFHSSQENTLFYSGSQFLMFICIDLNDVLRFDISFQDNTCG